VACTSGARRQLPATDLGLGAGPAESLARGRDYAALFSLPFSARTRARVEKQGAFFSGVLSSHVTCPQLLSSPLLPLSSALLQITEVSGESVFPEPAPKDEARDLITWSSLISLQEFQRSMTTRLFEAPFERLCHFIVDQLVEGWPSHRAVARNILSAAAGSADDSALMCASLAAALIDVSSASMTMPVPGLPDLVSTARTVLASARRVGCPGRATLFVRCWACCPWTWLRTPSCGLTSRAPCSTEDRCPRAAAAAHGGGGSSSLLTALVSGRGQLFRRHTPHYQSALLSLLSSALQAAAGNVRIGPRDSAGVCAALSVTLRLAASIDMSSGQPTPTDSVRLALRAFHACVLGREAWGSVLLTLEPPSSDAGGLGNPIAALHAALGARASMPSYRRSPSVQLAQDQAGEAQLQLERDFPALRRPQQEQQRGCGCGPRTVLATQQ